MLRFVADHNFDQRIVRGLLARLPELDLITVAAAGLREADDPTILAWAAEHGRVVLTHDVNTMPGFAYERTGAGLPMPGVIEVSNDLDIGTAIDEIAYFVQAAVDADVVDQVRHLPL